MYQALPVPAIPILCPVKQTPPQNLECLTLAQVESLPDLATGLQVGLGLSLEHRQTLSLRQRGQWLLLRLGQLLLLEV